MRSAGTCCLVLLWGLSSAVVSTPADEPISPREVDALWRDHLLWRADTLRTNRSTMAESFCRNVFQLDPTNVAGLDQLTRIYAAKGEAAMLAMTALLASELYPGEPAWKTILAQAEERVRTLPREPSAAELAVPTNRFSVYLKDAVRTREKDRNLVISELSLRRLLLEYPLNLLALEELTLVYRQAEEWTMCAMANSMGARSYPDRRGFLYNYLEAMRRLGAVTQGLDRVRRELDAKPEDATLLELGSLMAEDAGQSETWLKQLDQRSGGSQGSPDDLIRLGEALIRRQRGVMAIKVLEMAHGRAPQRYEPVYHLAVICALMNDGDTAERWLLRLRPMVEPDRFRAMVTRGPFPTNVMELLDAAHP